MAANGLDREAVARDVRATRKLLGVTQAKLAELLLLGKGGDRIVRAWEKGEHAPPGPARVALAYMRRDAARARRPFG